MMLVLFYNFVYLEIKTENNNLELEYKNILNKELSIQNDSDKEIKKNNNKINIVDKQEKTIEIVNILNEETDTYKINQKYLQGDNSINLEIKINVEFLQIIRITKKIEDKIGKNNIESVVINNKYLSRNSKRLSKRHIENDIFECLITINCK